MKIFTEKNLSAPIINRQSNSFKGKYIPSTGIIKSLNRHILPKAQPAEPYRFIVFYT